MKNQHFILWLREVVQPQADPARSNAAALDDFSPDGMTEYLYPHEFQVQGDAYYWTVSTAHTKGRSLCTHYELWFFGPAFGAGARVATGPLTKSKVRKGLQKIYRHYYPAPLEYGCPQPADKEN